MASDKAIPEGFIDKIKQVYNEINVDHFMAQGAVCMLVNIRFMRKASLSKGGLHNIFIMTFIINMSVC